MCDRLKTIIAEKEKHSLNMILEPQDPEEHTPFFVRRCPNSNGFELSLSPETKETTEPHLSSAPTSRTQRAYSRSAPTTPTQKRRRMLHNERKQSGMIPAQSYNLGYHKLRTNCLETFDNILRDRELSRNLELELFTECQLDDRDDYIEAVYKINEFLWRESKTRQKFMAREIEARDILIYILRELGPTEVEELSDILPLDEDDSLKLEHHIDFVHPTINVDEIKECISLEDDDLKSQVSTSRESTPKSSKSNTFFRRRRSHSEDVTNASQKNQQESAFTFPIFKRLLTFKRKFSESPVPSPKHSKKVERFTKSLSKLREGARGYFEEILPKDVAFHLELCVFTKYDIDQRQYSDKVNQLVSTLKNNDGLLQNVIQKGIKPQTLVSMELNKTVRVEKYLKSVEKLRQTAKKQLSKIIPAEIAFHLELCMFTELDIHDGSYMEFVQDLGTYLNSNSLFLQKVKNGEMKPQHLVKMEFQ